MSTKILFVDDEQHVLSSHRRTFRKKYDVVTAMGGEIALEIIETKGPFPVVVCDMQMPGMNGVQLLSKIRKIAPDTIRIMLTGNADLNTAMEAVNEGNVYRFLTKPCHPEQLAKTIDSGIRQYQLIKAEQELLNKTLKGSIKVLIDILSMIDQQSFSRTLKLRDYIRKLCKARIISSSWELDISALLSQIGQVTIPSGVISKIHKNEEISDVEKNMLDSVPRVGHDLLANIPRLENVSKIILYQNKLFNGQGLPNNSVKGIDIPLGSRTIKILIDFLQIKESGKDKSQAIEIMQNRTGWYDPNLLNLILKNIDSSEEQRRTHVSKPLAVTVENLRIGQTLMESIETDTGQLLIFAGQKISKTVLLRIINWSKLYKLKQPFYIVDESIDLE